MTIYNTLYDNLVESRKCLKEQWVPIGSGLDRHHIIPRHAGGTDEEDNFSYLTHREHIAAHWLLWKIHGRDGDKSAWMLMRGTTFWPTWMGMKHTEETKRKIGEANRGKKRTEEHRRKMSEAKKGKKKSEETRRKMSESRKGMKHTEETRRKMSEVHKNPSEETRRKISEAGRGRPCSEETRRKISEGKRNPSAETRRNISEGHKNRKYKKRAVKPV